VYFNTCRYSEQLVLHLKKLVTISTRRVIFSSIFYSKIFQLKIKSELKSKILAQESGLAEDLPAVVNTLIRCLIIRVSQLLRMILQYLVCLLPVAIEKREVYVSLSNCSDQKELRLPVARTPGEIFFRVASQIFT